MIPGFLIIFFLIFPVFTHAGSQTEEKALDYSLTVSFRIPASKIFGIAEIGIPQSQNLKLFKENLRIIGATFDDRPIKFEEQRNFIILAIPSPGVLKIQYEGAFEGYRSPLAPRSPRFPDVIDERGIWLTGAWYPKPEGLCRYRLTAILPKGFEAVSEGERIQKSEHDKESLFSFDFPHPLDLLHLIATNRYTVNQDRHGDIAIYAYFFAENQPLAPTYLAHAKKYLDLYEKILGKYPYKRFTIVENFLPTGYSMPTFTLLGSGVIQLPFIVDTSLGHEILHQWFGNSVYIDYSSGNWAEGLTTYLSDHLYEEEKGKGWEYRKKILIDYQSYVKRRNDFPLRHFQSRVDQASEAIGYGKGMMVFHMLRKWMGDSLFYTALRSFVEQKRFQKASWEDLQKAFAQSFSSDLSPFFHLWLWEKGLPEFEIDGDLKPVPLNGRFEVSFNLVQKQGGFPLRLPVAFYTIDGKIKKIFPITEEKTNIHTVLDSFPLKVGVDEEYDLPRKLSPREFPPVIARLWGDGQLRIVRTSSQAEKYAGVIHGLERQGAKVEDGGRLSMEDLKNSSAIFLGAGHPLIDEWFGNLRSEAGFSLIVRKNPLNEKKVIGIVQARSREEAEAAFPKIRHYGKFSEIAFEQGHNVLKKIEESDQGISLRMVEEPAVVDISVLKNLRAVREQIAGKKIIYMGESHELFSHHVMQWEMIHELHREGKKIAIGMEMFQRPFQKVLDDFIQERIDEREFIRRSEYFRRWGYDYRLYRPILQLARRERIPVVALNAPKEITERVARGGLDSLSAEEKKMIPAEMDFTDEAYRDRIEKVFQEHKALGSKSFEFFLQAQILWDETMADTIDSFLKENAEYQMVVLAGSGHIAFRSGIPKRTFRRNGLPYAVILNDGPLERTAADFVLLPGTVPFEGSPKLMVVIQQEKGGAVISEFPEGSISAKAGLRKGDTILALDQIPVQSIDDIRRELALKRKGDPIRIRIRRPSPSGENSELEFSVLP